MDLVERTVVAGVITQGTTSTYQYRVTEYKVAYMKSASSAYEHVTDAEGHIKVHATILHVRILNLLFCAMQSEFVVFRKL